MYIVAVIRAYNGVFSTHVILVREQTATLELLDVRLAGLGKAIDKTVVCEDDSGHLVQEVLAWLRCDDFKILYQTRDNQTLTLRELPAFLNLENVAVYKKEPGNIIKEVINACMLFI